VVFGKEFVTFGEVVDTDHMPHPRYEISDDADRIDVDVVHEFLAKDSYWARGIPRDVLERAMAWSLNLGAYTEASQGAGQDGGQLAGYARVVTDRATFGWLCDLFVVPEHRGRGVARELVRAVRTHPDLQGVRRLMLATADAHGLYESEGYRLVPAGRFMEIAFSPERLYAR
jgi:ribosomal protein S18 acetylase RimI-like enzyme